MGHVINPISHRIGLSRFWNSNWALANTNLSATYSYSIVENVVLLKYLNKVFLQAGLRLFRRGIMFLNFKLTRCFNKLMLIVFSKLGFLGRAFQSITGVITEFSSVHTHLRRKRRILKRRKLLQIVPRQAVFNKPKQLRYNTFKFNKFKDVRLKGAGKWRSLARPWLTIISQAGLDSEIVNYTPLEGNNSRKIFSDLLSTFKGWRKPAKLNKESMHFKLQRNKKKFAFRSKRLTYRKRVVKSTASFILYTRKQPAFSPIFVEIDRNAYFNYTLNLLNTTKRQYAMKKTLVLRKTPVTTARLAYLTLRYLFISRWVRLVKNFINIGLNRLSVSSTQETDILFVLVPSQTVSAQFISHYLASRLLHKIPARRLIFGVLRQLQNARKSAEIVGFKLACNGRFERRGRASHTWKTYGKLPQSDVVANVDYSLTLPVLVNSIVAVRVWLMRASTTEKFCVL